MNELFGLSYSPWTQKARWALEHHEVPFRYVEHLPMIGELPLRLKLRRPTGKVTVPTLFTGDGPIVGSFAIARHAERAGRGLPLIPEVKLGDIEAWDARSERALAAGRGLVVARTARSDRAKAEALPPFVPAALRPALTGVASSALAFFRWKYGLDAGEGALRDAVAEELRALRDGLAGRPYLLGDFSYADITMAVTLQLVRPAGDGHWPLKEATREVWRDPDLEAQFPDLIEWRDRVLAQHRRR
jgi:glutathione S-transferase